MQQSWFVTGIHTDAGKTVAAALLTKALDASYWKPIQAGDLDFGDTDRVRSLTGCPPERFLPIRHELRTPASPHYAARLDGVEIKLSDFSLPPHPGRPLIVEGAGGLLVPLNEQDTVADLIAHLGLSTILVSRHYLGSINHTLLSIDALQRRGLPVTGLIYSGGNSPETVRIIRKMTGLPVLAELPELETVDAPSIARLAGRFGEQFRAQLIKPSAATE